MSKVTIKAKVKIEQADYDKIVAFANRDDTNPELKDLSKLMEKVLTFNFTQILAQIAAAEVQERPPPATAKVGLYGPDNQPLAGTGEAPDA